MKTDPFDSRPGEYDAWYDENQELFREEIGLVMDWVKGSPSLEIGAGTGRFASSLGIGFGLDRARGALELARGRGIRVVLGDAGGLPFKKECFALVGIFFSLEFFADPASALAESARVIGPGGTWSSSTYCRIAIKAKGSSKRRGEVSTLVWFGYTLLVMSVRWPCGFGSQKRGRVTVSPLYYL